MTFLLAFTLFAFQADNAAPFSQATLDRAANLRERALKSNLGYEILESLTTEVGPRLAGSPADAAAVAWGQAKFKELGFDKVWTEEVTFPAWERGIETAAVISPYPQPLTVTALGHSVGTPETGIEAEVFRVDNLMQLNDADPAAVKGKIVFIDNKMERSRSGEGYGKAVGARAAGPSAAARLGAVALLIRSVGTDSHRMPHTGVTRYEDGIPAIPAAALSAPDANQLTQMLRRGKPVKVALKIGAREVGKGVSYNVIGEIRGTEKPEEVVVIGGHLDSWDLGTGALDDGAGCAIGMAAAKLIAENGRPRRTVRVVLFANEEAGLFGGEAYAAAHKADLANHVIGAESDFGAGRIYKFSTHVAPATRYVLEAVAKVLAPLGIELGDNQAGGGPDLGPIRKLGMPVATLHQDGTDYFDYHHTPDDTLDKVDPAALAQNVAAYAVFAYMCAESHTDFGTPVEATEASE